ncbi:MAG: hypothetical protein JNK58_02485 [Phycisphaerae bacterium]|nr:hypothetical protein [Phycisphaerae bacterium]
MHPNRLAFATSLLILSAAGSASAQVAALPNPGFEIPLSTSSIGMQTARNWRELSPAFVRRRFMGDTFGTTPLIRTGVASVEVIEGGPMFAFAGIDTDNFNSGTLMFDMPIYSYNCGPVTWSMWFAVPADSPFLYKRIGQKWEFKRSNLSVFESMETLPFGPEYNGGTGHTNGQFVQQTTTITQADFEWRYNFYNDTLPYDGVGEPWPDPPIMANLVHTVFGTVPNGMVETGRVFFDDVVYSQHLDALGDTIEVWDDLFTKANLSLGTGIAEPAIPVFMNGVQRGYPCLAGNDNFKVVEFFDEAGTTGFFPLTWSDIVSNGYLRPLVQFDDGTSGIGASVITGPSYKATGQPLKLIPAYSRADITAGVTGIGRDLTQMPPVPGTPTRTNNFKVKGTGNYGPATLISTRDYGADPAIGNTACTLTYTWTATSNITLDSTATGRGFDAFRLITISSMLANLGLGQYDSRYIAVESPTGVVKTLAIDESPRGVHLFSTPQPTAVGRSFWLYQDNGATFNQGSPTIEVRLTSLTGAPGTLGVNAFLDSSTNPNDDSLTAWLEWTGAPATINAGTVITATFTIRALEATDLGDANHDGVRNCDDAAILVALCGQTEADANFNAYADMNRDGTINAADEALLEAITGPCPGQCNSAPPPCPGDADGNGSVNFADITNVLANFGANYGMSTGPGDADHNGLVNFADITAVLANFGIPCPT